MSLENLMVDEYRRTVIIDLGMCLRVPFAANNGGITDVSAGTMRLLIKPLIPCGKPNYISPEIYRSREPFDGFGIDLWALGIILFIMLTGLPPWEFASEVDPRYRMVMQGGLEHMLRGWERPVSPAAADLLQRMLNHDPRQRLSLIEIRDHAWVLDESSGPDVEPASREGWRR
jgi:serine/threonine protein kinase